MKSKDLKRKINSFSKLPYKKGAYAKKNWGHPIHSLCSYPSKLKPAIANSLITTFTSEGESVLDTFSGSGTVPFEACNEGRNGIGIDLSPLAHRITLGKVSALQDKFVRLALEQLNEYIIKNKDKIRIDTVDKEITSFYHDDTLREIVCAKDFCLKNPFDIDEKTLNFLWSNIAHILHGNRPYALSRRSHNIIPIPPKGDKIYKSLMKSLEEKVDRMTSPRNKNFKEGISFCASAFNLPFNEGTIDNIITSPPFLGTTDFLRQNRVRLWFAGWGMETQKTKRPEFLEYDKTLDKYDSLLKEYSRVLSKDGLIIMHLGVIKEIDMAKEISKYAKGHNLQVNGIVYENVTELENHGRTDRGSTHTHQFLFLTKIN